MCTDGHQKPPSAYVFHTHCRKRHLVAGRALGYTAPMTTADQYKTLFQSMIDDAKKLNLDTVRANALAEDQIILNTPPPVETDTDEPDWLYKTILESRRDAYENQDM